MGIRVWVLGVDFGIVFSLFLFFSSKYFVCVLYECIWVFLCIFIYCE